MSYCVNCGVKLAHSEKVCPLCNTEVINPRGTGDEAYTPYPSRVEMQKQNVNRVFLALLGTIILLIPAAIALVFQILARFTEDWPWFIYGAIGVTFCFLLLPLLFTRKLLYLFIGIDTLAVALYVALIGWLSGGMLDWYLSFALPVIALLGALATLFTIITRIKKLRILHKIGICLFALALGVIIFEVVLALTFYESFALIWCWYVMAVLLIFAALMFVIASRVGWSDEIRRRLFT